MTQAFWHCLICGKLLWNVFYARAHASAHVSIDSQRGITRDIEVECVLIPDPEGEARKEKP